MGISRLKIYSVTLSFLWVCLILYFTSSSRHFETYKGKLTDGVQWISNLLPNREPASILPLPTEWVDPSQNVSVVMQVDENDIGGLIAAVHSIVQSAKVKVLFNFIVPQSTMEHLQKWLGAPEFKGVEYVMKLVPPEFEEDPNIGKAVFADIFPELQGTVIYLDPDVIIQGNLGELINLPVPSESLGSFSDDCHSGSGAKTRGSRGDHLYGKRINLKHPKVVETEKELKLHISPLTCTFNTGVFVTHDVDRWRKAKIPKKVLTLIKAHAKESILGTQGSDVVEAAMLVVLYDRTSPLDPLWNVRSLGLTATGSAYSASYLKKAKLVHWSGHFKPWNRLAPEQQLWDQYFVGDPLGKFQPIRKSH